MKTRNLGTRLLALVVLLTCRAHAQDTSKSSVPDAPSAAQTPKPIPIISGYVAFVPTWEGGEPELTTILAPVVVIPIGDHWIIESRVELEGGFVQRPPDDSFGGQVGQSVQYAQLDYIANKYVTVSAGRYLIPFGIFNERLYPNWVRVFQTDPLIFPVGTGTGSGDGAMLRGGIATGENVAVNYAVYFSAASNADKFEAERVFGGRFGVFLPRQRVELGFSLQKALAFQGDVRVGLHGEWQPHRLPLDLRGEFGHARDIGSGYWLEGAYRLEQARFWRPVMRKTQLAARVQQSFKPKIGVGLDDATRTEFAINYFLRDGLKAFGSAGRTWSPNGDSNIWTIGFAYRFVIPLARPSDKNAPVATPDELLEGEQRFRTNCGRCHMPPHKFGPRVMSTAVHHMRVRAMLTDEDMRLILKFLTQ